MPKKTGFKKSIPKKIDTPQAEEFIKSAGKRPARTRTSSRKKPDGLDLLKELAKSIKAFDPNQPADGMTDPLKALKILLEQISLWEKMETDIVEKKLRAERRAGEILKDMDRLPTGLGLEPDRADRLKSLPDMTADQFENLLKTGQAESDGQMKTETKEERMEEIMDDDFRQAVERMIEAIKNADEKGWTTTSKRTALRYIEMFRHMVTIDGLD